MTTTSRDEGRLRSPLPTLGEFDRALELVDRLLARGCDDVAHGLLRRTIDAFGVELAKRDPVTASMLELDRALAGLAVAQLRAPERATSRLRGPLPFGGTEARR